MHVLFNALWITLGLGAFFGLKAAWPAIDRAWRRQREQRRGRRAFGRDVCLTALQARPDGLASLRGRVDRVGLIETVAFSAGSPEGCQRPLVPSATGVSRRDYTIFLIVGGDTFDVATLDSRDDASSKAAWLGEALQVPVVTAW